MKNKKYGKAGGFTLAEILVTSFIFLIFALTLMGTLIMGMRYSRKTNAQIAAQQTCRNAIDAICSELRQAAPNPAPGSTGYQSVSPAIGPTAVLFPNVNTQSGNYILFTAINYANWDPSSSGFDKTHPDNYKQIRYFVQDNVLYRRETLIAGGAFSTVKTLPLAEARNGSIELNAKWDDSSRKFLITVTVVEDKGQITESAYTASTGVVILVD